MVNNKQDNKQEKKNKTVRNNQNKNRFRKNTPILDKSPLIIDVEEKLFSGLVRSITLKDPEIFKNSVKAVISRYSKETLLKLNLSNIESHIYLYGEPSTLEQIADLYSIRGELKKAASIYSEAMKYYIENDDVLAVSRLTSNLILEKNKDILVLVDLEGVSEQLNRKVNPLIYISLAKLYANKGEDLSTYFHLYMRSMQEYVGRILAGLDDSSPLVSIKPPERIPIAFRADESAFLSMFTFLEEVREISGLPAYNSLLDKTIYELENRYKELENPGYANFYLAELYRIKGDIQKASEYYTKLMDFYVRYGKVQETNHLFAYLHSIDVLDNDSGL